MSNEVVTYFCFTEIGYKTIFIALWVLLHKQHKTKTTKNIDNRKKYRIIDCMVFTVKYTCIFIFHSVIARELCMCMTNSIFWNSISFRCIIIFSLISNSTKHRTKAIIAVLSDIMFHPISPSSSHRRALDEKEWKIRENGREREEI